MVSLKIYSMAKEPKRVTAPTPDTLGSPRACQVADVVVVCGTESVIREMVWGGNLHKDHTVRDVRIDVSKQARTRVVIVNPR